MSGFRFYQVFYDLIANSSLNLIQYVVSMITLYVPMSTVSCQGVYQSPKCPVFHKMSLIFIVCLEILKLQICHKSFFFCAFTFNFYNFCISFRIPRKSSEIWFSNSKRQTDFDSYFVYRAGGEGYLFDIDFYRPQQISTSLSGEKRDKFLLLRVQFKPSTSCMVFRRAPIASKIDRFIHRFSGQCQEMNPRKLYSSNMSA